MSPDIFVEQRRRSWLSKIGQALVGVLVGLLLLPISLSLLYWNEGRAVRTATALSEGADLVVEAPAAPVDPGLDGRLVHVTGPVGADEPLDDAGLGIASRALRLYRKVEIYEWRQDETSETRKSLGGSEETVTTYRYSKAWTEHAVDSSTFREPEGHRNPTKPVDSAEFIADGGHLGEHRLTADQLRLFGEDRSRPLAEADLVRLRDRLGFSRPAHLIDGAIVFSAAPDVPDVGDLRISYTETIAGDGSLIARQTGDGFAPWRTTSGHELLLAKDGTVTAEAMFKDAMTENVMLTWALRLAGLVLLFMGFRMVLGPVVALAEFVPALGTLAAAGATLVSLPLAILLGGGTIAIAWISHRPLVGSAILAVACAAAAVIWIRKRPGPLPASSDDPR